MLWSRSSGRIFCPGYAENLHNFFPIAKTLIVKISVFSI